MRQNKFSLAVAATVAVAALAGCGGGSSAGNQAPKIQFTSQVVFGDSLSDVGSYAVGSIILGANPSGTAYSGGRYTVNAAVGSGPAHTNWTELMAGTLNLPLPCPAETGLEGDPAYGFYAAIKTYTPQCTSYAQGGAMVTDPYGPGNANTTGNPVDGSAVLGQLTVPIVTQIQNHLAAHGGAFSGTEVVFLLAGGNDAIFNSELYVGSVAQAYAVGGAAAAQAEAATAGPAAVQAMVTAGTQLAGYINNLILANGAKYVVLVNLPDLSTTPYGAILESNLAGTQALVKTMVTTFNSTVAANVSSSNVLIVDAFTTSDLQISNPAQFSLTNVTTPACNLNAITASNPTGNPLASPTTPESGTSLVCNATNVIAGDISHYEFADQVHPTPYGNILLARYVASQMAIKGWL
jgi:phospholipase/lecithinase/hemolysin